MIRGEKTETIRIAGLEGKFARPYNSLKIESLVIMLHGWSINSDYMSNFFPIFLKKCHHTAFYAPDAPYPCSHAEEGRQWFEFDPEQGVDFYKHNQDVELSTHIIDELILAATKAFNLPLQRIILSGYSQGGVMTLAEGTRHNLAGLLVFAGVLLTPHTIQSAHGNSPEIMFIHGRNDEVMPLAALEYTKQILLEKDYKLQTVVCEGSGHSMNELSLEPAIQFVRDRLK